MNNTNRTNFATNQSFWERIHYSNKSNHVKLTYTFNKSYALQIELPDCLVCLRIIYNDLVAPLDDLLTENGWEEELG